MEYLPIVLIVVAVVALTVGLLMYFRKKSATSGNAISDTTALATIESVQDDEISVPIVQLPATTVIDERSLFEITDRAVISRISSTFPNAAQVVAKTATNRAVKSAELFKLDIPSAALAKSKEAEGAFRAFSRGKSGITKNANLTKVTDVSKLTKASALANTAANVMNVGSLVVGQYYMSEIKNKLESMGKTLDKVSDFQDREFKSRILSLLARVGEVSQFSTEIMENNELRNIKLTALEDLKGISTELLGQVNITITDIAQKNPNPKYDDYQKNVDDFALLIEYQTVLLSALDEISKLTYLLGKGGISSDMCYSLYSKFLQQSIQTRNALEQWHNNQVQALRIDLDKNRISKSGIEGVVSAIPGLVDDNWKYKVLKQGLVNKINAQAKGTPKMSEKLMDVYDDDVEIIIKDGKYYYLHKSEESAYA